jgi:hypothetical protein
MKIFLRSIKVTLRLICERDFGFISIPFMLALTKKKGRINESEK